MFPAGPSLNIPADPICIVEPVGFATPMPTLPLFNTANVFFVAAEPFEPYTRNAVDVLFATPLYPTATSPLVASF